jgi:hypothetical protein
MANAEGIARIFEAQASASHRFISFGTGVNTLNDDQTGTWTRSGATITWNGPDPSFTIPATADTMVDLRVNVPGGTDATYILAQINHTGVPLDVGDTIVYTSIQISFTTDDLT